MTTSHHPERDVLAAYVAGALRPGFDLVVAAHLDHCSQCRREKAELARVAARKLADSAPLAMSEGALARAQADIEKTQLDAPAESPPTPLVSRLKLKQRRWLAPGVWVAAVDVAHEKQDRVYLLNVPPGVPTLQHSHRGVEFTCILSGVYVDGGVNYYPGDFIKGGGEEVHQPRVGEGEPCLCLIATQGKLKPATPLGRVLQLLADV